MTAYANVAAGDPIVASTINDLIGYGPNCPAGRLVQAVAQTGVVNNTTTAVTFTTEVYDTHGFHSTSVNTSRVTPTTEGLYRVKGAVSLAGAADYTSVESAILKNGTPQAPATRILPGTTSSTIIIPVNIDVDCNGSTDYFEISFRLNRSGAGTGSTAVSSQFASVLEWQLIRTRP